MKKTTKETKRASRKRARAVKAARQAAQAQRDSEKAAAVAAAQHAVALESRVAKLEETLRHIQAGKLDYTEVAQALEPGDDGVPAEH